MAGCVRPCAHFVRNLESGGYLELQEFGLVKCDDDTLNPDQSLYRACKLLEEGAAMLGRPYVDISKLKGMLQDAGFVDITEKEFLWPSNPWTKDKKLKELGLWNQENLAVGFSAFLMAILTRALGWSKEEVDVLTAHVKNDVSNRKIHSYWPM
jgi:hypothetical protein